MRSRLVPKDVTWRIQFEISLKVLVPDLLLLWCSFGLQNPQHAGVKTHRSMPDTSSGGFWRAPPHTQHFFTAAKELSNTMNKRFCQNAFGVWNPNQTHQVASLTPLSTEQRSVKFDGSWMLPVIFTSHLPPPNFAGVSQLSSGPSQKSTSDTLHGILIFADIICL